MVAGADVLVDAVLDALDPLAALQQPGDPGLDAALALELARQGARLVLVARTRTELDDTVAAARALALSSLVLAFPRAD